MQLGILVLICLAILAITGVTEDLSKRLMISRFGLFMLCFSCLVLNTLTFKVVPEFILNPASLFLIIAMLINCFERGEKGFSTAFAAVLLITAAQIALSKYVSGAFWGLVGVILPIALTEKRIFTSMLCICIAPMLAYISTVMLEVMGVSSIYFSEANVFNAQITGILSVGMSAYLVCTFDKNRGKVTAQ